MKTIATFNKPEDAHLLRMRLEAVGIPAFIQDENFVQLDWLLSNAVGGARLQVSDDDLEATREFLAADAPQPCPDAVDVACPSCGAHDTAPDETPRRMAFLSILIIRFPLLIGRDRWRCTACRHLFNVPRKAPTSIADFAS
jgi:hypothetical protein